LGWPVKVGEGADAKVDRLADYLAAIVRAVGCRWDEGRLYTYELFGEFVELLGHFRGDAK